MKELLRHIKDLPIQTITIKNRSYPVHVDGTGDIPLLSIGIGSHLQMTLPVSLVSDEVFKSLLYRSLLDFFTESYTTRPIDYD